MFYANYLLYQMAQELNKLRERDTARDFKPTTCVSETNGFLKLVVSPLFEVVKAVSCSSFDYARIVS